MIRTKNYYRFMKYFKKFLIYFGVIFITLLILFPIIYMIPFAWKNKGEINNSLYNYHWLPQKFTWNNFKHVFQIEVNGGKFLRSLGATTLVSILGTFLVVLVTMLAGYGFARHEFKGKKVLFGYVLFTMFIPGITTMLTSIRLCNMLGLTNTILVLFLPGIASGFNVFFFRQYFLAFPDNLEEAAMIDGASRWQIFTKIFVPMAITPMVIVGVGSFMGHWNNYLWVTLTITDNEEWLTQVMQIIRALNGSAASKYGQGIVIAATMISLIIPFTLYAVFQKKIVEGIALTGTK